MPEGDVQVVMGAPKGVAHRRPTDASPERRGGAAELATHRRAVPPQPRWTKYQPEGRADTTNPKGWRASVQPGLRFVAGVHEWCYLCNDAHPIEECPKPCPHLHKRRGHKCRWMPAR